MYLQRDSFFTQVGETLWVKFNDFKYILINSDSFNNFNNLLVIFDNFNNSLII